MTPQEKHNFRRRKANLSPEKYKILKDRAVERNRKRLQRLKNDPEAFRLYQERRRKNQHKWEKSLPKDKKSELNKRRAKSRRKYSLKKVQKKVVELFPTIQDCRCPRCEKTHKCRILWVGRGIPIKFCSNCKKIAEDNYIEYPTAIYYS